MSKGAEIALRFAIALAIGLAVAYISLNAARVQAVHIHPSPQDAVRTGLSWIDRAIHKYQDQHQSPPPSLSQLKLDWGVWPADQEPEKIVPIRRRDDGVLLDPWFHPYDYRLVGEGYTLTSYGRDGKPGGIGLDCDRTDTNPNPPEAELTFPQLFTELLAKTMIHGSEIGGVFAFLLALFVVRTRDFKPYKVRRLIGKIALTLVFAATTAWFMILAELPTGH